MGFIDFFKSTKNVSHDANAIVTRPTPQHTWRRTFAKVIASGIDPDHFQIIGSIGSGQTVAQSGGNLVIGAGATARSETIIRSLETFEGALTLRQKTTLSQRNANNNFIIELVDVIGDGLAYTINSTTSITVTFPTGHGFTSENVGQSMTLAGFSGTGTFLSGRYAIASVSGDNITFTVSGFAAGSGTCSAFGWNFHRLTYNGATATSMLVNCQRDGWAASDITATISTTASGHNAIYNAENGTIMFMDHATVTTAATIAADRISVHENVPDSVTPLYLQIRSANGSTAPTATTWTVGYVAVEDYVPIQASIVSTRPQAKGFPLPVRMLDAITASITALVPGTAATNLGKARDSAIGATDTGVAILGVRRDAPTAETPAAGDYVVPQVSNLGAQYVHPVAHTAGGATPYKLVSAATTNATSVKASAGQVYSIIATNTNATVRYLKLYNKASAPTVGTDTPVQVYALPAGGGVSITLPVGMIFSTGIAFATTTGAADSDTAAVAANEILINLTYL